MPVSLLVKLQASATYSYRITPVAASWPCEIVVTNYWLEYKQCCYGKMFLCSIGRNEIIFSYIPSTSFFCFLTKKTFGMSLIEAAICISIKHNVRDAYLLFLQLTNKNSATQLYFGINSV